MFYTMYVCISMYNVNLYVFMYVTVYVNTVHTCISESVVQQCCSVSCSLLV